MSDTLDINEAHPSSLDALKWIRKHFNNDDLMIVREALASCALEGNRLAEVCLGTLNRLLEGKPVGDRYVLGLSWLMINMSFGEDVYKKTLKEIILESGK
jgi:hypothetical protein